MEKAIIPSQRQCEGMDGKNLWFVYYSNSNTIESFSEAL